MKNCNKYHKIFLFKFLMVLFLCPYLNVRGQQQGESLGLLEPTLMEQAKMARTMVETRQVLPNKLALDRVTSERLMKGLSVFHSTPPARVGEEVLSLGGSNSTDLGSSTHLSTVFLSSAGRVDNSQLPHFPPIRSQGSIGSCASFSAAYTVATHMLGLVRGTNTRSDHDDTTKLSPKFTYSLVNRGRDSGSSIHGNLQALVSFGAPSWALWPYVGDGRNPANYLEWPRSANVWRSAANNRLHQYGVVRAIDTPAGLQNLKSLLANGYLLLFGTDIYGWEYTTFSNDPATSSDNDLAGRRVCWRVVRNPSGHAMTVVGYDDNVWTDINRDGVVQVAEKGALKIANSWGTDWEDWGFVWIAYDALRDASQVPGVSNSGRASGLYSTFYNDEAYWITAQQGYSPTLLGEFTVSHGSRDQMGVRLGKSGTSSTTPQVYSITSDLNGRGGAYGFDGTTSFQDGTFVFDFTDLQEPGVQRYFLTMSDAPGGATGSLNQFRLTTGGGTVLATATSGVNTAVNGTTRHAYVDFGGGGAPPVITSATSASGRVGESFFYRVVATNSPTSFDISLPVPGLHQHGQGSPDIFGTPTSAGSYTVALAATNPYGTGSAMLQLEIAPALVIAPAITSNSSASARVGDSFTYTITASGNPSSFGASGLPSGLQVNTATGTITGTPTQAGIHAVSLSATNAGGTGTRILTLTVAPPLLPFPEITSQTSVEGISGAAFLYRIEATNNPTSYGSTELPSGLSLNSSTGVISGRLPSPRVYTITLLATNARGTTSKTLTLTVKGAAISGPPNDDFANRIPLKGVTANSTGTNLNAGVEDGEPNHIGQASHSAWWTWTAPRSAPAEVSLSGSQFDTVLAVYSGNGVGNLTFVASNDDASSSDITSQLTFNATSGKTYQIAIDGYGSQQGEIALSIAQGQAAAPANDNFANAENLDGSSATAKGSSQDATAESGEPAHAGQPATKSVWWKWTAPGNGSCTIDTKGSAFDTVLAVYTGSLSGNQTHQMVSVAGGILPAGSELAGQSVSSFQIGKYEVTWEEWQEVRAWAVNNGYTDLAGVGEGSGQNHPVHATWYDVVKWMNARSEMEGLPAVYTVNGTIYRVGEFGLSTSLVVRAIFANGYRLPTEAEWEWAANSGGFGPSYEFSGSNNLDMVGWYLDNSYGAQNPIWYGRGTWPIGSKIPNQLGIFDMSGNVSEWCEDLVYGYMRRIKGGGWASNMQGCTIYSRGINYPYDGGGFRLARNSSGSGLQPVASDDQSGGANTSLLSFNATQGTTYYFAVDGRNGAEGAVVLNMSLSTRTKPANDDFANAAQILGSTASASANSTSATAESGEPNHAGSEAAKSVWWSWIAPTSGPVRITTAGSNFDTVLAVYTGTNLYSLLEIAANDDANGLSQSSLEFEAVAGTTYWIAVDGFGGESGNVLVSLTQSETPSNDSFAAALPLDTSANNFASATGSNRKATFEPGERAHSGSAAAKSLWWSWTAPHSATVTINTYGSEFDTVLAVYTGSALAGLAEIASNDDFGNENSSRLSFHATKGTTYRIALDGYAGRSGRYELWVEQLEEGGIYATDFETFPAGPNELGGFDGWVDSDPNTGSSGIFEFDRGDQSMWIGYNPPNSTSVTLERPVDVPTATGKIEFSVDFCIMDSTGPIPRDEFEFSIINRGGDYLAGLAFDNSTRKILRYFNNNWSDVEDTSVEFENGVEYTLSATIDLLNNTWSAWIGGKALFRDKILTTNNKIVNIGTISVSWYPRQNGNPGDNYMIVDNYRISTTKLAPVITSPGQRESRSGETFDYQIIATNAPQSFSAAGLPPGLVCNPATGRITGKPSRSGTSQVTLSATNEAGTGSKLLLLAVEASGIEVPAITSTSSGSAKANGAFTYQITATNAPTSYEASGLPAGLSIDSNTGLISGIPTTGGIYSIALSARNLAGTGSAPLLLTITSAGPAPSPTPTPHPPQGGGASPVPSGGGAGSGQEVKPKKKGNKGKANSAKKSGTAKKKPAAKKPAAAKKKPAAKKPAGKKPGGAKKKKR
jgi:formylglycine-generating enzyme required for sulfatase activity